MEEIVGRWNSLSITEEEGEIVGINDETLQESEKESQCGVLGKAHNLPMRSISEKIGMMIGEALGVAIRVWKDREGRCSGSFLRIRVMMDISKPVRRVIPVRLGSNGAVHWAELKYERIPDFCYVCGCIGHIAMECHVPTAEMTIAAKSFQYGDWLIAPRFSSLGGGGGVGTRKDAREIRRPPGEGSVAESGLKLPAGLPASPNLEGDSLATDSRDLGPNFGETDGVPEVSAAVELPKNSPQIEEPLTSISGRTMVSNLAERAFNKTREEQVTRDSISAEKAPNEAREEQVKLDSISAGKASSEAREEQVSSKGLLEESREQDHADLKVPLFHFLAGNELKHTRRKHKKGLCRIADLFLSRYGRQRLTLTKCYGRRGSG
ncbi:hypothetical protein TIFTF001_050320 [Ficus carica]|uniref:CCHC-type domain-containing protein n=1 Tax=Ficus carica TaxID=3494 RepID=A0AA87ZGS4_FICCA|nr:hypothetical protein TIFTF001_050320 [Ficus carica]